MNQKGIASVVIVVVVVVVVAGAGVGVWVATGGLGGGGAAGGDISTATSLSFKTDTTVEGTTITTTVKMKNIGSSNLMMRLEETAAGQEYKYIVNGSTSKAWMWTSATGWVDMSSQFSTYFSTYQSECTGYTGQLSGWTGGDYTYTCPTSGATVKISSIEVNPTLDDSLFQAS